MVLLHAAVVVTAAWTVRRADWSANAAVLTVLALGGLAIGLALAKTRVLDLLAHLVAFTLGAALSVWATLGRVGDGAGGWRERVRLLWGSADAWYSRTLQGKAADDAVLFFLTMGVTVWLVAYTSAWVLYRRGWLGTAVVLPGIVTVVNLGYAPERGTRPLLVFVVAACVLAARHHAFRREQEWARSRLPAPPHLPRRFLTAGTNVALVAAMLGWTLPLSAGSELLDAAWDRVQGPWTAVERRWNDWFDVFDGPGRGTRGAYSAFGESFRLGGPLELSDEPVLRLEADAPAYLIGHRYDRYDGRGWASDVDRTFDPVNGSGERYSPQMTFKAAQKVPLSPDVLATQTLVDGRLTVLREKGDLLFTLDTYVTSDRATSVQLSWRRLEDEPYRLGGTGAVNVPTDLVQLATLLRAATFEPGTGGTDATPTATDPDLQRQIAAQQAELERRFLSTRWDVARNGKVTTLYVSGQLPIYDDVEAVFGQRAAGSGEAYAVVGAASVAAPSELRRAGTEYPPYVEDRYLQLPATVTDQTRRLAVEVTQGLDNPFDRAIEIQNHLRGRITYREDVAFPPDNRDVVDYVLFESRQGYCEYYASAMVVMLRSLDIPARMVTGYAPAEYDAAVESYVVREKNAHAWVEAYFPGYGWIPFEPTANRPVREYSDGGPRPASSPLPSARPTPAPSEAPSTAESTPTSAAPPATTNEPPSIDRAPAPLAWASALTGLALLAAILAAMLVWSWGLRGMTPAGAGYARALRVGRWWGVRADPATTPAEYASHLGRAIPSAQEPARALADLYAAERYGAQPLSADARRAGHAAWLRLRAALLRSVGRRHRLRRGGS